MPHKLEAGFGLNKPGDGNLGLGGTAFGAVGSPVPPSQVNPIASNAPLPAPSGDGGRKFRDAAAAGLLAFTGANPIQAIQTVQAAKERRVQAAQLKNQSAIKSFQLGISIATQVTSLPFPQQAAFTTKAVETLMAAGDKIAADTVTNYTARPADIDTLNPVLQEPMIAQMLKAQGPVKTFEFLAGKEGRAFTDRIANRDLLPGASAKVQQIVTDIDDLVRKGHLPGDVVERIRADGFITVQEMQEMNDRLPDGLDIKLSSAEVDVVSRKENEQVLIGAGLTPAKETKPAALQSAGTVTKDGKNMGHGFTDKTGKVTVLDQETGKLRPLGKGELVGKVTGSAADVGLAKIVHKDLQTDVVAARRDRDELNILREKFTKEAFTIPGKIKSFIDAGIEFAGFELDEASKERTRTITAFRQDSMDFLNRYIQRLTGAAIGGDAERLRLGMATIDIVNDTPEQFLAGIDNLLERGLRMENRALIALEEGLERPADLSFQRADRAMEAHADKANEVAQKILENGGTIPDAIKASQEEIGLDLWHVIQATERLKARKAERKKDKK